jgi:hypothetical protein
LVFASVKLAKTPIVLETEERGRKAFHEKVILLVVAIPAPHYFHDPKRG